MAEFESLSGEDTWDADFANDLVGCTLLVGLTYLDHDQQLIRRQQVFGTVTSVDEHDGICIRLHNDQMFTIAPVLDAIEPAEPGIYQLADEDEAVEDPDFTALLTVISPSRN
jgi:hypothetical protein